MKSLARVLVLAVASAVSGSAYASAPVPVACSFIVNNVLGNPNCSGSQSGNAYAYQCGSTTFVFRSPSVGTITDCGAVQEPEDSVVPQDEQPEPNPEVPVDNG